MNEIEVVAARMYPNGASPTQKVRIATIIQILDNLRENKEVAQRVRDLCDKHDSGERVVYVWRIRKEVLGIE